MQVIIRQLTIGLCLLLICINQIKGQESVFFTPNNGQWDSRISYSMNIPAGNLYLEKNKLTYFFIDRHSHHDAENFPEKIDYHAVRAEFIGANADLLLQHENRTGFYYNYFYGQDPSKWKSEVYSFYKVNYKNVYSNINFTIGKDQGQLKSFYTILPGGNANEIKIKYTGADKIEIIDEKLIVKTTLCEITESKPVAWQIINGSRRDVSCKFKLENNVVTFDLGLYDPSKQLIIDPVLYFSTYIGSTADDFGCTATYDKNKHAFGGALVYPTGLYPTTLGAYQTSFAGALASTRDMGITKFDSTGTYLRYSTYLGGAAGTEVPHSLVCDNNGNLFVLGTSGSNDYPVTAGALDISFNGGTFTSATSQGLSYPSGTDLVITKFNSTGTGILGSTYLGGTNNDGVNSSGSLNYNYGDFIRGEIILDGGGNPIVCSNTFSTNFPITVGAPQTFNAGACDAIVTKLNSSLSGLSWSTYYGGTGDDAGYGIQPDMIGDLFFTGGTVSADIPTTLGTYDNTSNGGVDGFLAKINAAGTTFLVSTYIGTAAYDQSYLVQVDLSNNVYICGQSIGAYPQTPGLYNNGNSGQFIHKFNNSVTTSIWSTRIGRNSGQVDVSPTAFLVNNCYSIFFCGWGGFVNTIGLADFSTTTGMPITAGSFQTTTDGNDFYLAIFSQDMASMDYATFFGGPISDEHVDGGTSRFDKDGVVYQAVCAGCGSNDDFPTTPGAWSATNNSPNCNLAVFKFNLDFVVANALAAVATPICTIPYSFQFNNLSTFTSVFYWDFGDGTSSTAANPSHAYNVPGDYDVMLIAIDTTPCAQSDTFFMSVHVPDPYSLIEPNDTAICAGSSFPVDVGQPGSTFTWSPSSGISTPTLGAVTITPSINTTYQVIGTNSEGCVDMVDIAVTVYQPPVSNFTLDFDSCFIPAAMTFINNGTGTTQFFWDFGDGFTSTLTNPSHSYSSPGSYTITLIAIDTNFCGFNDTSQQTVFIPGPLNISVSGNSVICVGTTGNLNVVGGSSWVWSPASSLSSSTVNNPTTSPTSTTTYSVIATDGFGCTDSATFPVIVEQPPVASFTTNFTPCVIPNTVSLNNTSTNAENFIWILDGVTISATDLTHVFNTPGTYTITLIAIDTSFCGFSDTTTTTIFLPPPAVANAWGSDTVCTDTPVPVHASGGVTYSWSPPGLFNNPNLQNPLITPVNTVTGVVTVTDTNGCQDTASVSIFVFPVPFIDAGIDEIYDFGDGPVLNPIFPLGGTYYWTPPYGLSCTNCANPMATPENSTTYYFIYTDVYGCIFIDSLEVLVTPTIYIPNAFTPNGDGFNDYWLPIVRNLDYYEIMVFDRWGELIFTTDDRTKVWDGTHKNMKVKEDVYVWKLKYTTDLDPYSFKEALGHVTVLR